ncbi:MAG: SLBB domain-containing protein [candidate division Zixibacteria bacterium]|nr:SLBB domain-containing protein [candidate division Zixibacteria bacterium]
MKRVKSFFSMGLTFYMMFFQLAGISKAQSQADSTSQRYKVASQYYLEKGMENKLMMSVNVWGAVEKPGAQYVPDGSDLISVLSAAGGPVAGAKLSQVRLVRNFDGEKFNLVIDVNRCLKKGEMGKVPEIKPGDTVIVPKSRASFGKFITVIYNAAVIASVVKLMTD